MERKTIAETITIDTTGIKEPIHHFILRLRAFEEESLQAGFDKTFIQLHRVWIILNFV